MASLAADGTVAAPGPVASTSTSASASPPILAGPPQLDPLSSLLPPSTSAPAPPSTCFLPPTLSFPQLAPQATTVDLARPLSIHLAPPSAAHVPPGVMSHHLATSPFFQSGMSSTMSFPAFLPADEPGERRLEPDAFWQSVDSQFAVQYGGPPVPGTSTSFPLVSSSQEDTLDPACASCPHPLAPTFGTDALLAHLQMTPSSWRTCGLSTSLCETQSSARSAASSRRASSASTRP